MSNALRQRIFDVLDQLWIVDPHTHINPHAPSSQTLADVLGYHYYTELAHSAGLPKEQIEEPGISAEEKVRRLVLGLAPLENTVQYSWLIEMLDRLFGIQVDRLTAENWQAVFSQTATQMAAPGWAEQVLQKSKLTGVFLTNDFDDPLTGFDTQVYIPCLRTDDLVFKLHLKSVQERLHTAAGMGVSNLSSLKQAVGKLFAHFVAHGAKACAISLPPDFTPIAIGENEAENALRAVLTKGEAAGSLTQKTVACYVFWLLAEFCAEFKLPFDLMIGVNRAVYQQGVYQGQDLYDSRVSLLQYKELFNRFPQVQFPISVLASVTNQELVSYAWIFPNVLTHGHWWYSNTPEYIERDLAARLEAVPSSKQIGYYSDMYKLEFALPKFGMYKRILAKVLAERFCVDRGWTEERAITLGTQVLKQNTGSVFGVQNA